MHHQEKFFENHKKEEIVEMSDECKKKLEKLNKSSFPT